MKFLTGPDTIDDVVVGRLARGENKQSRSHLCIIVLQAQTINIHIDHGQDIDLLPNTYLSLRLPYHIVLQRIEYRKKYRL